MDDTEVLEREAPDSQDEEEQEAGDLGEFLPGELCAVDATNDRIDLDDCSEEQREGLASLAKAVAERDQTSYRIEVRDAWKQRYFWRGNQYLLPGKNGSWVLPRMVLMAGQSYDDHNSETNCYLAFGDTICAALTAGLPGAFFEPENPTNPLDVTTSDKAEGARKLFERANDVPSLQSEMARFLFTDGRAAYYTHHVLDAQRFGWTTDDAGEEAEFIEPEDAENQGAESKDLNVGRTPRSQQVVETYGVLETKFPIKAKTIEDCDFVQLSREFDIARLKTKYWQHRDEITAAALPTAQSDYVRLARVSINMGMRPSNMTTDAQTFDGTEQLTWVRPGFYEAVKNDELLDWLHETFPKGCMIAMVGSIVVEARNESMDDHWSLVHGRPGDGMHRPSLGYPLVPLQEKLNDCMDLVHQSFMHLIPRIWVDPSIDLDALEKTEREPGQYMKAPKSAVDGKSTGDLFFAEPQLQLAEGLLVYLEKLFGEWSQFLVGAFPALFGGDTKSNDTASGIAQQRDQALGRVGLTWRNIKTAYARMMRQAIVGIAEYQVGTFSGKVKDAEGAEQFLELDPDDLKGNVRCFCDMDENFPESWVAQRAIWNAILAASEKNPILARIFAMPKNILAMKNKIGTPELVIPEAASEEKQLVEIHELLDSEPLPNPQYETASQILQHLANEVSKQTIPPEVVQLAKQKVQQIPPYISSVKVDQQLDEHAFEAAAMRTFSNTREGRKAKVEKPQGWINFKLHYMEHLTAAAQNAQNTPPKPPSESINYKDLETVEAKIQMLGQAGIKLDPASLKAEIEKEKATSATGTGAGASSGNSGGR